MHFHLILRRNKRSSKGMWKVLCWKVIPSFCYYNNFSCGICPLVDNFGMYFVIILPYLPRKRKANLFQVDVLANIGCQRHAGEKNTIWLSPQSFVAVFLFTVDAIPKAKRYCMGRNTSHLHIKKICTFLSFYHSTLLLFIFYFLFYTK